MDNAPDQTVENSAPESQAPFAVEPKKGPAYGAILGIILIVAVLVVGAFYVWGERLKQNDVTIPEEGVPSEGTMPRGGSVDGSIQIEADGTEAQ